MKEKHLHRIVFGVAENWRIVSKTLDRFLTGFFTVCLLQLFLNCKQPVKSVKLPLKLCKFLSEKSELKCSFNKITGHQLYQHSFPCGCFPGRFMEFQEELLIGITATAFFLAYVPALSRSKMGVSFYCF